MGRFSMTDPDRADVRTAYRPLIEGLAEKPGTVSFDEWAAAVDRVFPGDGKAPAPEASAERAARSEQIPPGKEESK